MGKIEINEIADFSNGWEIRDFHISKGMYAQPIRNGMGYEGKLKTPWLHEYYPSLFDIYSDLGYSDHTKTYLIENDKVPNQLERLELVKKCGGNNSSWADKARGSLLGLAIGDAFGVPLEFSGRDTLPIVKLFTGGGPFNLEAGQWTDDTSMAACLAYSLIQSKGFDFYHQAMSYIYWYKYSAFRPYDFLDIGLTIKLALDRFIETGEPIQGDTSEYSAGNGCIMKLAPVSLFYSNDYDKSIYYSGESSRITHQAKECIDSCKLMGGMIAALVNGVSKEQVLSKGFHPKKGQWLDGELTAKVAAISRGEYKNKTREQIKSTGYVIDTLEAALWAFYNTDNFYQGLVLAVNLAGDSDTVGAVYGQIAGAYYGESSIPYYFIRKTKTSHHFFHIIEDFLEMRSSLNAS